MRMKNILSATILIVCLFSCASPQKSFKKGNYEKSFSSALKNLRKGNKDRKDKQYLNKSFNELLKKYQSDTQDLLSSDFIEDFEEAYKNGKNIIGTYNLADEYLDNEFAGAMENVGIENDKLLDEIVSNYYSLANEYMAAYNETKDKSNAREAYRSYQKVESYDSNKYSELNQSMEDALNAGTIHVIVEVDSWELSKGWMVDQRFNDLERRTGNEFVQVYFEEDIEEPDCLLEVDFGSLDIDERSDRKRERFSERVVDYYETTTDTSGVKTEKPVYEIIEGEVNIYEIERRYTWSARVRVKGFTNSCDFNNKTFDATISDSRIEYETSGDERAIPNEYKKDGTDFRLSEREVAEDLIDEIYDDFKRYYFRNM